MRCLMIPVLLVLAGCGGEKSEKVSKFEYGERWPFIVENVDLLCHDGPPAALVRTEDGKLYALNGSARSKASENGWLDGRSLTKPNVSLPGTTMDYSEITARAMKLCPSYAG